MAKAYAKKFYNSAAWRKTSKAYAASKFYLCERCGKPYKLVHHIKHITPYNISDPGITLDWDNLMCVCQDCHAALHSAADKDRKVIFDENGNVKGIEDSNVSKD